MRSFYLLTAILSLSVSFSSCKKDYSCHCVFKTNGSVAYEEDSNVKGKEDDAIKKCDENDFSENVTVGDSTYLSTAECDVKNK